MKRRFHFVSIILAFSPAPSLHAQRAIEDPLTIFAKLMPVLTSERCANCHGATDPYQGFYHPGAVSHGTPCVSCHTASARWDVAPPIIAFFKKTTRQLCYHFSVVVPVGEETAKHLETDDLIGLAFAGRRGNAVPPQFTQKPPMTRAEFVRAYRNWVAQTGGGCSSWEGTITRTETIPGDSISSRDMQQVGQMTVTHWQNGEHTITVKIKDGAAVVTTTLNGEVDQKEVIAAGGCEVIGHTRDAYSLVSTKPSTPAGGPPAGGSTAPLAAVGNGTVRIGLAADGSYRINVVPPGEKSRTTTTTTNSTSCPVPFPAPPAHTGTYDWDPWVFEIAAKLPDPKKRTHLEGQTVEMLERSAKRSLGLAFMGAAVGRLDGTTVKFKVTTTWDLKRAP